MQSRNERPTSKAFLHTNYPLISLVLISAKTNKSSSSQVLLRLHIWTASLTTSAGIQAGLHRLGEHRSLVIHIGHPNSHRRCPCPRGMSFIDSYHHKLIHMVCSLKVQPLVRIDDPVLCDGKISALDEVSNLRVGARITVCGKHYDRTHLTTVMLQKRFGYAISYEVNFRCFF